MDRAEITKRINEFRLQDMLKAQRPKVRLLKQSPEERAAALAELERFEAAWLAKMTPTDQDRYKAEMQKRENARQFLSERSTLTNLDIEALKLQREEEAKLRERAEVEREAVELAREDATSSQGGTDRKLRKAEQRITELEAKLKATEAERDAARKAYLALLDMIAKAEGGK